ncbi:MAG: 2-hydroxyacid dehydrogenase [Sandarakinorhabdus sp.]|nr:2-hydroxyacid dehydrogenase [Sandarakinorhabdus sp.]
MDVAVFNTRPHDRQFLDAANRRDGHVLRWLESRLTIETAGLAAGFPAVCVFVNDVVDAAVLGALAQGGTRLVATRSAGFNHIDLQAAARLGIAVARVPAYSPHAVAEHAVAMMLTLNRKIHRAWNRVREGNFALDGLLGFDMVGKTVGIIGAGQIGAIVARIVAGFGCRILASDPVPDPACEALGATYLPVDALVSRSDIITLHCPLTPATHHLIDAGMIGRMKRGAMLINTSRGAVIDTSAVIAGLKSGQIGHLGLDVYEEEADLFFEDLSDTLIQDDVFARLLTFPNVLITGHQAFFTTEALTAIAETTIANITAFAASGTALHMVSTNRIAGPG